MHGARGKDHYWTVRATRLGLEALPTRPLGLRTPRDSLLLLSVARRGLERTLLTEIGPLALFRLEGVLGAAVSTQFSLSS